MYSARNYMFLLVIVMTTSAASAELRPPTEVAAAESASSELEDMSAFVRFDLGYASALGFGGVNVGGQFGKYFQLEGGLGFGFTGVQLSVMPKLTVGSENDRFVLGVGATLAIDESVLPWFNAEVGYEHRWNNGVLPDARSRLHPHADAHLGLAVGRGGGSRVFWRTASTDRRRVVLLSALLPFHLPRGLRFATPASDMSQPHLRSKIHRP